MSIFLSFDDFCKNISNNKALIGIDLGEKTIGIAVSDKLLSIASPLKTLKRKKFKENSLELLELINLREIEGLVLGLPINMDGSEGPRCQSTRAFAYNFSKLTDLSITFMISDTPSIPPSRAKRGSYFATSSSKYFKSCFLI